MLSTQSDVDNLSTWQSGSGSDTDLVVATGVLENFAPPLGPRTATPQPLSVSLTVAPMSVRPSLGR